MVSMANGNGNFPVVNGALPCEGTKAFPFKLDFSATNAWLIDLTPQWQQKQFTTLQCVWMDNSLGDENLEIICDVTEQSIICPPRSQGFFELLQPVPPKFMVQTNDTITKQIILLNFYIPPQTWFVWQVNGNGYPQISIPAIEAIIVAGALTVTPIPPTYTAMTDASGTITAGGTKQVALAANAARKRFVLANPDTATETLYLSFIAGDGVALIPLIPGEVWDESGSTIAGGILYVQAATTAHAYTLNWY